MPCCDHFDALLKTNRRLQYATGHYDSISCFLICCANSPNVLLSIKPFPRVLLSALNAHSPTHQPTRAFERVPTLNRLVWRRVEGGKQGIRANFLLAATRMSRPASCSASGSPPDRSLLLQQQLNDRASLSWLNRLKQDKDTPRYAPNKTSRQVNALSLSLCFSSVFSVLHSYCVPLLVGLFLGCPHFSRALFCLVDTMSLSALSSPPHF